MTARFDSVLQPFLEQVEEPIFVFAVEIQPVELALELIGVGAFFLAWRKSCSIRAPRRCELHPRPLLNPRRALALPRLASVWMASFIFSSSSPSFSSILGLLGELAQVDLDARDRREALSTASEALGKGAGRRCAASRRASTLRAARSRRPAEQDAVQAADMAVVEDFQIRCFSSARLSCRWRRRRRARRLGVHLGRHRGERVDPLDLELPRELDEPLAEDGSTLRGLGFADEHNDIGCARVVPDEEPAPGQPAHPDQAALHLDVFDVEELMGRELRQDVHAELRHRK